MYISNGITVLRTGLGSAAYSLSPRKQSSAHSPTSALFQGVCGLSGVNLSLIHHVLQSHLWISVLHEEG